METSTIFKLTSISAVPLNFTNVSIAVDDTGVVRGLEKSFVGATGTCRDVGTKCVSSPYPFLAHKLVLLSSQTETGERLSHHIITYLIGLSIPRFLTFRHPCFVIAGCVRWDCGERGIFIS